MQGFVPDAAVSGERGTQDSNLESPVLETAGFSLCRAFLEGVVKVLVKVGEPSERPGTLRHPRRDGGQRGEDQVSTEDRQVEEQLEQEPAHVGQGGEEGCEDPA